MKVLSDGYFDICVYSSEVTHSHHLPHCHIRFPGGATVVALPTLKVIAGEKLSKKARILLFKHLEEVYEAWNKLNPIKVLK